VDILLLLAHYKFLLYCIIALMNQPDTVVSSISFFYMFFMIFLFRILPSE